MKMTRVREIMASLAAILLIIAFGIGVLLALGKRVPYVSDWLSQ